MILREKWDPDLELHQDYDLGASSSAHPSVSSLHSPDLDSEPPSSAVSHLQHASSRLLTVVLSDHFLFDGRE